jgi:hypothetical protein
MERTPNPETSPIQKGEVIERFKEKGREDAETIAFFSEYIEQQEGRVDRGEIDLTDLNVSLAEIYREAGFVEEAVAAFEDTAEVAWGYGRKDIYNMCQVEIERLKG